MASTNSAILAFGADWSIVLGSASQRAQGSVAFLRSATLTVNGAKPKASAARFGFRLNAVQAAAVIAAKPATGKAGRITLPLVKRGRPVGQNVGLSGLASALTPAKAPRKARAPRKAKVATTASTDAPATA